MVFYFANPSTQKVRDVMGAGVIGFIDTPAQGNRRPDGVSWCADNGCFGKGYPGDEKWLAWLTKHAGSASSCVFATAPDVVGDAVATLERSLPWLPVIRELGYPAAFVAQDGLEDLEIPWDSFDVLFVGGSTGWKLGPAVRLIVAEAKVRGKWVHMGRVNSFRRFRYAEWIGCDSVDGTFVAFAPDVNLGKLLRWIGDAELQPGFDFGEVLV